MACFLHGLPDHQHLTSHRYLVGSPGGQFTVTSNATPPGDTGLGVSQRTGRAGAYADGARDGTPGAMQVADPCRSYSNASPRNSLSRRVRDLLAGDLGAHRDLPVDPDPDPVVTAPEKPPVTAIAAGSAYAGADAAAAWERRRNDLQHLAGITDVLTDVERRADELNRRAAALVEGWLQ